MAEPSSERILSIDALRGFTILVMIFVNDVAGVTGTPAWMQHHFALTADGVRNELANGMTFVDWVFPGFLFLVGMSIPFAIGRRMDRGESMAAIWKHILVRTLGLLIIGVLMVNCGGLASEEARLALAEQGVFTLNRNLWVVLMYLAVIMVWNTAPREPGPKRTNVLFMKGLGVAMLIALAAVYRTSDGGWMSTQWWGILGLIGWAYLVATLAYTLLRHVRGAMFGMTALLYGLYVLDAGGMLDWMNSVPGLAFIKSHVAIGAVFGTHGAITVAGVALGMMLRPGSGVEGHAARIRWALIYGAVLWVAGFLLYQLRDLHDMFIINKILATPPWGLLCSAYTVWLWVLIYWLMDVKRVKGWSALVRPAGENPLFAYILHPLWLYLLPLIGLSGVWGWMGDSFAIGFWRSLGTAFAITFLAGGLKNLGIRLRL